MDGWMDAVLEVVRVCCVVGSKQQTDIQNDKIR